MRALIEQSRGAAAPYRVVKVFSDKPAAAGLETARNLGIPAEAAGRHPGQRSQPRTSMSWPRPFAAARRG